LNNDERDIFLPKAYIELTKNVVFPKPGMVSSKPDTVRRSVEGKKGQLSLRFWSGCFFLLPVEPVRIRLPHVFSFQNLLFILYFSIPLVLAFLLSVQTPAIRVCHSNLFTPINHANSNIPNFSIAGINCPQASAPRD
jgi:hypothetical protein